MKTLKLNVPLVDARKNPIQKPPEEGGGPVDFRFIAVSSLERGANVSAEELNQRGLLAERIVEAKETIDVTDQELGLLRKVIPTNFPIPPIVLACNRVMDAAEPAEVTLDTAPPPPNKKLTVKKGGK